MIAKKTLYYFPPGATTVQSYQVDPIDAHDAVRRFPSEYFLTAPAGHPVIDATQGLVPPSRPTPPHNRTEHVVETFDIEEQQ